MPVECLLGIVYYRQQKDGLLSIYCNITSNKTGSTDLYCIVYKGWVEKNLLFEKIVMALEGERFVLGGCPEY